MLLFIILYLFKFTFTEELYYYDEDYGKDWVYFPDEEGTPHYVSLRGDDISTRLSVFPFESVDDVEQYVQFRFYHRNSSKNYTILNRDAQAIDNTKITFNNAPIKIITHGWRSSAESKSVLFIANAYLNYTNYNVIGVDWSEVADNLWYPIAATNTKAVGDLVALFIQSLKRLLNIGGEMIHLIGHSLGSHIMGNAAYKSTFNISRITALDPARPLFEYPSREHWLRLDEQDAHFVDAIHTCAGVLGFESPIGDADFYPNGGSAPQPGCGEMRHVFESCSHGRAYLLFAETIIHPDSFVAYPCENWVDFQMGKCQRHCVLMGEAVDHNARGKYFLNTNSKTPFGLGHKCMD